MYMQPTVPQVQVTCSVDCFSISCKGIGKAMEKLLLMKDGVGRMKESVPYPSPYYSSSS
jgi:hypothetical protein